MRPGRFPKVNDVMLAEALLELIPVAEGGVRVLETDDAVMTFRRAETILKMWTRQEKGRIKKLGGPLPPTVTFEEIKQAQCEVCGRKVNSAFNVCLKCFEELINDSLEMMEQPVMRRHCRNLLPRDPR